MNRYMIVLVLILSSFLALFGQNDSKKNIENDVSDTINSIMDFQTFVDSNKFFFNKAIFMHPFCQLNEEDTDLANRFLKFLTNDTNIYLENSIIFSYLKSNYECFTIAQKKAIQFRLGKYLQRHQEYYYEIVSLFNVQTEYPVLLAYADFSLFEKMKADFFNGGFDFHNYTIGLKTWATIANLGDKKAEKALIEGVKDFYHFLKVNNKNALERYDYNLQRFYSTILPNTIGLLYSKRSIEETIYIFDEDLLYISPDGEINENGYIQFFLFNILRPAVKPKIVDEILKIFYLDDQPFDTKVLKIKDLILNDPTIWKSYIRLE